MRADWLAKYYSPPSSRRKTKWLLSVYCPKVAFWDATIVIQLVWYILKQLFTPVFGESGGYLPRRFAANIHHYSPPLWWIIIKYILYNVQCICWWILRGQYNIKTQMHLFFSARNRTISPFFWKMQEDWTFGMSILLMKLHLTFQFSKYYCYFL